MENIINLIVNNGVAVVVVAYFLFMNYKYFDKLTAALTEVSMTLRDIQEDLKRGEKNDVCRCEGTDKENKHA